MNQQQELFVNYPLCDMRLLGIPGGGKTFSIIEKINSLFLKQQITKSQFILLTFTRDARNDFLKKGKLINKKLFN